MSSFAVPSFSTARGRRSSSSTVCTSSAAMGGFPGRPAGRPGTPPGPDPGPVLLGDVPGFCRSMIAWSCGPGRGPSRARARAGPGAGSHVGGFDDRPGGGCGASRLRDAGLRPHCSHPPGSFCCCVCLGRCVCCLVVPALALGADWGRARCLDAFARLSGSLVARHAALAAPGSTDRHDCALGVVALVPTFLDRGTILGALASESVTTPGHVTHLK